MRYENYYVIIIERNNDFIWRLLLAAGCWSSIILPKIIY